MPADWRYIFGQTVWTSLSVHGHLCMGTTLSQHTHTRAYARTRTHSHQHLRTTTLLACFMRWSCLWWRGCWVAGEHGGGCSFHAGTGAWPSIHVTKASEDCLTANVYTPKAATALLPVMVYFHAGEFIVGGSNDDENNWPFFANGRYPLFVYVPLLNSLC